MGNNLRSATHSPCTTTSPDGRAALTFANVAGWPKCICHLSSTVITTLGRRLAGPGGACALSRLPRLQAGIAKHRQSNRFSLIISDLHRWLSLNNSDCIRLRHHETQLNYKPLGYCNGTGPLISQISPTRRFEPLKRDDGQTDKFVIHDVASQCDHSLNQLSLCSKLSTNYSFPNRPRPHRHRPVGSSLLSHESC